MLPFGDSLLDPRLLNHPQTAQKALAAHHSHVVGSDAAAPGLMAARVPMAAVLPVVWL